MALLLKMAGMDIPVIATYELTDDDKADARSLNELSGNTNVVRNISWYPLDECIARIRPDYFLAFGGPEAPYCARFGVKHRNVSFRPHLNGFEAAGRIFEILLRGKPGYSTLVLREEMRAKAGMS